MRNMTPNKKTTNTKLQQIPSFVKRRNQYNPELNFRVCDLKAQGYSLSMIQKKMLDDYGLFRTPQFYHYIVKSYLKKYQTEGSL